MLEESIRSFVSSSFWTYMNAVCCARDDANVGSGLSSLSIVIEGRGTFNQPSSIFQVELERFSLFLSTSQLRHTSEQERAADRSQYDKAISVCLPSSSTLFPRSRGSQTSSTGATGYIGGEILYRIAKTAPETKITALVRDAQKGGQLSKSYPDVHIVHGELDDSKVIEKAAGEADVVVREYRLPPKLECHSS